MVECIVSILLLSIAAPTIGWLPCVLAAVVCVALLVWLVSRLKKTEEKSRRKIKGRIVWVMLIPSLPAVFMVLKGVITLFGPV